MEVQQDAVVQLPMDPPAYSYDQPGEGLGGPNRTPEYPPPPSYAAADPPPSYPGPPVQSAALRSLQATAGNILVLVSISRQREVRVARPDWRHRRRLPGDDVYHKQSCLASCAVLFGCFVFGIVALVLLEHARSSLSTDPVKSRRFARASVAVAVFGIIFTALLITTAIVVLRT